MMKCFCFLLLLLLLVVSPPVQALDEASQEALILLPVEITEIYPNAAGSPESAGNEDEFDPENPLKFEYIELHNLLSIPYELDNFYLSRESNETVSLLDDIIIPADGYLAVFPDFSLTNTFHTDKPVIIQLNYVVSEDEEVALAYEYQSGVADDESWSLNELSEWQTSSPTPGEPNFSLLDDVADDMIDMPLCELETVFINEIVANPSGSDSDGGEFVELYNDGTEAVNLEGCVVKTDKLSQLILPPITLKSGGYYVVELLNDLLNDGGSVTFMTAIDEQVAVYPSADNDISWSVINGEWIETTLATPGAENQPTPKDLETPEEEGLEPCPEGKFRNPETNRCKNIVDTASALLPCRPGSARNPETNRCRKITSTISSLKPCDSDQERNPETNRCRKIRTTTNELKPCDEGEERNPETNRCRKVGAVLSGATIDPPTQEAGLHTNVFFVMTLLAAFYGIYEYRLDFINWFRRIKTAKLLQKQR